MTATPVAPPPVPVQTIDVRCNASLGMPSPAQGRCQLFVGHEPPHAILYAAHGHRTVRTWWQDAAAQDDEIDIARLPWVYGCPAPAWIDPDSPDARSTDPRKGGIA